MDDCVVWQGGRYVSGYGQRYRDGRKHLAHRLAWEDAHGPIPDGMLVHHRCHNKLCINVAHMELLSKANHGGKLGHGKLTREDAAEVRLMAATGVPFKSIAAMYDISNATVHKIVKAQRWADPDSKPQSPVKWSCRYCGRKLRPCVHARHERTHVAAREVSV